EAWGAFGGPSGERGPSDGNLQAPRDELDRCADNTIVADKVGDKLKLIETLSGLDFERFTRSMMLSQGQFAAFLNADANKRAELLEELTGTEIYGRLSSAVFERHKQAKVLLDTLRAQSGGMALLSEAQQDSLNTQLAQSIAEEQALTSQQQGRQQKVHELQQLEQLQRDRQLL
ncbi:MAG TPA: exonuclease subunit SbcC, partial [Erwinia persicina]|nr:exonuclease subunit SbcC [Erwinia persicina]